jgi:rod shape-determining protein MreC
MWQFVDFIQKKSELLLLIILEIIAFWLIIRNNTYQNIRYINTSNYVVAKISAFYNDSKNYLSLRETNARLAEENAQLKKLLARFSDKQTVSIDSNFSEYQERYRFIPTQVINNSVRRVNNYLTIDKGRKDGVEPGMGVVSSQGVAGIVQTCSQNFSTVTSLLHSKTSISARIKRIGVFGAVVWTGESPRLARMRYVARYAKPIIGDTIVTYGNGSVFPANVGIGVIENIDSDANNDYYDITVKLFTEFDKVAYVYVIANKLRQEQDSLELNNE